MDCHSFHVLEFDLIKERLASFACSEPGKKLCNAIFPKTDAIEIEKNLEVVQQAKEAISIFGRIPLTGLEDINPLLSKADQNGTCLEIQELLQIGKFLDLLQGVIKWLSGIKDHYPSIKLYKEQLVPLKDLKHRVDHCIDPTGEIKDMASPGLLKIRKQLRQEKKKILDTLEGILKDEYGEEVIQGDFITVRNNRYVIPVKANKKKMIQGIVHDESGSGATLFVEPMISVDGQNRYRRLKIKEQDEIIRILFELSGLVSEYSEPLRTNLDILTELDFIQSKALFSQTIDGIAPIISHDSVIRLKGAKHALLLFRYIDSPEMGSKPVPIDIELNQKTRALVISGPNTGGKTVTLKMVGLLQAMIQAGLHIPVMEGTEMGIFDEILADIGDEQDIAKDLSSFSSHVINITRILKRVGTKSIVLLDELGSDTNPTEGAALGIAVLEYILKKGALCLVTTHHNGLKAYASSQSHEIMNASMGFDPEDKKPTYILYIGYPGSSNALGICSKLGLPSEIIKRAGIIIGEGECQFENLLIRLQQHEKKLKEELEKQLQMRQETELAKEQYKCLLGSIEEQAAKMAKETHLRVQGMVEKARKEIEQVVSDLKKSTPLTSNAIKSAHKGLRDLVHKFTPPDSKTKRYEGIEIEKISVGQPVFVCNLKETGIVSRIDQTENKVWVMIGPLKLQVKADELAPAETSKHELSKGIISQSGTVKVASSILTKEVGTQLVVIGHRVEDALLEIDKYLDNAVLAGLSRVSIIHGKGTGALKTAIEKFLSSHTQVASFRNGNLQEGGDGITIVELAA